MLVSQRAIHASFTADPFCSAFDRSRPTGLATWLANGLGNMKRLIGLCTLFWLALSGLSHAQQPEKRIALVIGNAAYQAGALATPANDAGLIAQTLQAAGFDVAGARDLDQDSLRRALRDFVDKAEASG